MSFWPDALPKKIIAYLNHLNKTLNYKKIFTVLIISTLAFVVIFSINFFRPKSINYNYESTQQCITSPAFLPNLMAKSSSDTFDVNLEQNLTVMGYPLLSLKACVRPYKAPREDLNQAVAIAPLSIKLLSQRINVEVDVPPSIRPNFKVDQALSIRQKLKIDLDKIDNTFDYSIKLGGNEVICDKNQGQPICDLSAIPLKQAKKYQLTISRVFAEQIVEDIYKQNVKTVAPINIAASSIADKSKVHNDPTDIVIKTDKSIKNVSDVELVNTTDSQSVPIDYSFEAKHITMQLNETLDRKKDYELTIKTLESQDGGILNQPYSLNFQTSGGPTVKSINIRSFGVAQNQRIVLTFDVGLQAKQEWHKFISLKNSASATAVTIALSNDQLILAPKSNLPFCIDFTLNVAPGLVNQYGIGEGEAWRFNFKTNCKKVFSIGTSVQGRALTGYSFGAGKTKLIFVGGLHGEERSSVYLLNAFLRDLEVRSGQISSKFTVIVIPNMNPDGYTTGRRNNANDVNLNRNFPANSWSSDHNGGSSPLSEPESRALYNYISANSPRLVLTYHAAGSVVMPNEARDSVALAQGYAARSVVRYLSGSQSAEFFSGPPAAGTLEGWLKDKKNIATLLLELRTKTSHDYLGHKNAIWHLFQIL